MLLLIVWAFYDETNLAPQYNITQNGYIYYYLFSLISIPFQIVIDFLFYNIIDLYHGINFYAFLIDCKERFQKRKNKWSGDNNEIFKEVEMKSNSLQNFAFSSQYYFSITLAMSGMFFLVFGFQILIASRGYNIFADELALALAFIWFFICYFLQKTSWIIARFFKLWEISNASSKLPEEDKSFLFFEILYNKFFCRKWKHSHCENKKKRIDHKQTIDFYLHKKHGALYHWEVFSYFL